MGMVNPTIAASMGAASWIRRTFELARKLRAESPNEPLHDFSLGNPHLEPPEAVLAQLRKLLAERHPGAHRYMTTAGLPETRAAVAAACSRRERVEVDADRVLMTCGAAGAINVAFRTLLSPGDEVLLFAPCFAEYRFYCQHAGATPVVVPMQPDFDLNLEELPGRITTRTRLAIINSPNNPTGRVYPAATLARLAEILRSASAKHGKPIILLSDDPYRRLTYDGVEVPPVMPTYETTLVASSFSKDLGLAGERIGYLAIHPKFPDFAAVWEGLCFCLRTLGFVNAPALMQRAVAGALDATVDVEAYRKNRELLCDGLGEIGYKLRRPDGSFFVFPEAPGGDDIAFLQRLLRERVVAVPGIGFDAPGYFRVSFAASPEAIAAALPAFERAFKG